jgi:hypothetical protein
VSGRLRGQAVRSRRRDRRIAAALRRSCRSIARSQKAPVPSVRAVIVCAKVADFIGGAVEPGVQEWVRDRLGYLVTRDVRDGVRRGNAVRRRLAGRAGTKAAERHVGVDDGRRRADKTMVRAIAVRRRVSADGARAARRSCCFR